MVQLPNLTQKEIKVLREIIREQIILAKNNDAAFNKIIMMILADNRNLKNMIKLWTIENRNRYVEHKNNIQDKLIELDNFIKDLDTL